MNPKIKLFSLAVLSSVMIIFPNPLFIAVITTISVNAIFLKRVHVRFMPWIKPLFLVFFMIVVFQSISVSGLFFSLEGVYFGVFFSLRLLALISLVFLFVETTPASELVSAFSFLQKDLSQILMLALSMVPGVAVLGENIINSQKSRGMNFMHPNIFRTYFPVLIPLFAKTLYRSEKMSLAMQARGYGSS